MNTLHIDNHIAGAKTLWILRFPHPEGSADSEHLSELKSPVHNNFELLIPTPFNKDEWMVVSRNINEEWLDSLQRFQQMCEEAKERCQKQISNSNGDTEEKTMRISEEILNFTTLIRYFNDLMKRIRPANPPPEEFQDKPDL